jgi:6-phosphofructokinase 2
MKNLATLTMNPTIDVAYDVKRLVSTFKMRTVSEHYCPGGGGINVARVFVRLGGDARCYYLSGGATGVALNGLIDLHQLVRRAIPIAGLTRMATVVIEQDSGKEYRLVPPGPTVTTADCERALEALSALDCDMLVASGSLPPGAPSDFYVTVGKLMQDRGVDFILDTSGPALKATLEAGGVHLVKPSLGELRALCGRELSTKAEVAQAAAEIVERGQSQLVAVTMGRDGALLTHRGGSCFLPAVDVEAKSAVGAGDSFLAAMVHALALGREPLEAFRFGMAAGAAAVLSSGTDLAHPDDIERLLPLVPAPEATTA